MTRLNARSDTGRPISDAWFHRIKAATRDLVRLCGDVARAGEIANASKSEVSRWQSPGDTGIIPIAAALALQAKCSVPLITTVMADLEGRRLSDPDADSAAAATACIRSHHAAFLRSTAGVSMATATALADDGEISPAKKVRSSKRGGYIHLGGDLATAKRLDIGEGIETVLSVRQALARDGRDLSGHLFWSSIDLGNLGGKATETVPHPMLTWRNALGHVRRQRLPGPVPDLDEPSIPVPDRIDEVTLLGDGDSDRELTKNAPLRAARRFRRPGRAIRTAWAEAGKDFNDMWIEEMAE